MTVITLLILTCGPGAPGSPFSPLKAEPGNPWKANTYQINNTAIFKSKFAFRYKDIQGHH